MIRKRIKIKFTNGLNFENSVRNILDYVAEYYEFINSNEPDFIVFGPYGNDIPSKGNYVRIGYFCENFLPDMNICDWAFGIPYSENVNHPNYTRIEWHGFDPQYLVKLDIDIDKVIAEKKRFCNFIYSNSVSFREDFFRQLSKYKPIDSPGKSMNNMRSIDTNQSQFNLWDRKRNFISQYKFTIAFENYSYPGYHTEKILDPMLVNSIPIYWGNPNISQHFNPKSFINSHELIKANNNTSVMLLEKFSQPDFYDMRPTAYNSFGYRIKRKLKSIGRKLKIRLQYDGLNDLIEQIVAIDKDDTLYAKYLSEPWFYNNTIPLNLMIQRWKEIFG